MKSLSFLKIPPTAAAALGTIFPGYRFHRLLADDASGTFFEASDAIARKPLIFKVVSDSSPRREAGFREAFHRGVVLLTTLDHPNLLRVFHGGEKDGSYYFVSEAPAGGTLDEAVEGIRIKAGDAIRVVREICEGLTCLHANGRVHGELRPSHIWLDADARPKIGFTDPRGALSSLESFSDPAERRHYVAPEAITRSAAIDGRADVYSAGVILHRLLTGTVPGADPRPASLIAGCDPKLDEIIRKATDPLLELRYPNAAAMSEDLAGCVSHDVSAWGKLTSSIKFKLAPGQPAPGRPTPVHRSPPPPVTTAAVSMHPTAYCPPPPVRKLVAGRKPGPFARRRPRSQAGTAWSVVLLIGLIATLVYIICSPAPGSKLTFKVPPSSAP